MQTCVTIAFRSLKKVRDAAIVNLGGGGKVSHTYNLNTFGCQDKRAATSSRPA